MVPVRRHMDQHDDSGDLPLVTDAARVVDVTPLDESRNDEVRRAAARCCAALDRPTLVERPDDSPARSAGEPPDVDWSGVDALLASATRGPYVTALAALSERFRRPYPSLLSIRLRVEDGPLEFVPGQYVTVRFMDTPRPYSVASSPTEDVLEFCVRRVPGGRLTTDLFEQLDPGDEVTVRGPNGHFVLGDPSPRDLAFLATGTGVAPLKSMIEYCFETGQDTAGPSSCEPPVAGAPEDVVDGRQRDVWCFLGCGWEDDLPYREFFRSLDAEHDHFHFVPTLSRESHLTDWQGETAYVQHALMKYLVDDAPAPGDEALAAVRDREPHTDVSARIDPRNLEVYACGVSAMVGTLLDAVQQVGVPEDRASGEGFG